MDWLEKLFKKILFAFILFFVFASPTKAVPAAPNPTCEIEAEIQMIEKVKKLTPPLNAPAREVEYYSVNLKITKGSMLKEAGSSSCDNRYPIGSEKETMLFPNEYDKTTLIKGQKIKGNVHYEGDERFAGIFLSNVVVLSEIQAPGLEKNNTESSEISKKILEQKKLDSISNISWNSERKTYQIQGTKKGKLFFVIPVNLKIQLEEETNTGTIKIKKKPWWSFLVR